MRKAFDILPPQRNLGRSAGETPAETTVAEVPPVQAADLHVGPIPFTTPEPRKTWSAPFFGVLKSGVVYLFVGIVSFAFFSALFWGYNRYQDRQRTALEESAGVAGTTNPVQASLRILNGSGSSERLEALKSALQAKGYDIRSTANASQASDRTVIFFKAEAEADALRLAQDLPQFAPSLEKNDDITGVDNLVILLGREPGRPQ